MNICKQLAFYGVALVAGVVMSAPASAQSAGEVFANTTVTKSLAESEAVGNRRQEEYDPVGGRVGSFFLYPWVEDTIVYDDNVFATPTNEVSDGANRLSGGLTAMSNFPRHALNFRLGFDNYNYFSETSQDRFDVDAVAAWRLDFAEAMQVTGFARVERSHDTRDSLESIANSIEPVPYTEISAGTTLKKRFNRLTGSLTGTVATIRYENVDAVGGGTLRQHYRDGETYTLASKWSYEFSPGYAAFGMVEGNLRDFNNEGYGRSSQGIMGLAGVEFDVTSLVHGELGFGYLVQDYDKSYLKDIDGWAMRGALIYNPTTLITLKAIAERRIGQTIQGNASGRLDTLFRLTADYELLRNFILSPYIGYIHSNYEGSGRKDDIFDAGIEADYLINRNFSATLFYEYRDRDSNFRRYDFSRNYAGVGLKARF